jgi:hypothetical protein
MITHEEIESIGWFRSALASSKYEPNYFLRGSLKDFPSGIWLTGIGDRFRITTMNKEYHEVLFMGKIECFSDLIILMRMLDLHAKGWTTKVEF